MGTAAAGQGVVEVVEGLCVGFPDARVHSDVIRSLHCCGEQGLVKTFLWNCPGPRFMGS